MHLDSPFEEHRLVKEIIKNLCDEINKRFNNDEYKIEVEGVQIHIHNDPSGWTKPLIILYIDFNDNIPEVTGMFRNNGTTRIYDYSLNDPSSIEKIIEMIEWEVANA